VTHYSNSFQLFALCHTFSKGYNIMRTTTLRRLSLLCSGLISIGYVVGMDQQYENHRQNERNTLIQGLYRSGEVISKAMYFSPGERLRVQWYVKPAIGNCVVSLFSIFNADLLFNYGVPENLRPRWSEIAIETFGGSANRTSKQFQTQYITQEDPNDSPTQRGKQHVVNHFTPTVSNIYDDKFHLFEIDFQAAALPLINAQIKYKLDGKEIRNVTGGDANFLEPPLDLYAGVWVTTNTSTWGCTNNSSRPNRARVVVDYVKVDEYRNGVFQPRKYYTFRDGSNSLYNEWDISDWGFGGFDGAFDRSAVRVNTVTNKLLLELLKN
jgi:hypothetical protein